MTKTVKLAAQVTDVDLTDPDSYAAGPPHAAFDALRAAAPVAWHDERPIDPRLAPSLGGGLRADPGFWAVTSHELVASISRRPAEFSSSLGGVSLVSFDEEGLAAARQMMITMDPPEHFRLRRLIQPMFAPRAVESMRTLIARESRSLVAGIADAGGGDIVSSLASELPLRVLASLLGMPAEDGHLLAEWTDAMMGAEDPDVSSPELLMKAGMAMAAYGDQIVAARRAHPQDDLVSVIANAEVDGERLSQGELAAFWNLLVIAGNETTRNAIAGGVLALHEHGLWERLRNDRGLVPTTVEEILRYVTPVMHFRRTAMADIDLGGQPIAAGDKVVMFYTAANRDPSVFSDPHMFRPHRTPNPHLSFGVGAHVCIGAQLARLELSIVLSEMLEHWRTIDLAAPPVRVRSNFMNLHRCVEVSVTAS